MRDFGVLNEIWRLGRISADKKEHDIENFRKIFKWINDTFFFAEGTIKHLNVTKYLYKVMNNILKKKFDLLKYIKIDLIKYLNYS